MAKVKASPAYSVVTISTVQSGVKTYSVEDKTGDDFLAAYTKWLATPVNPNRAFTFSAFGAPVQVGDVPQGTIIVDFTQVWLLERGKVPPKK